ncbi:hypothetical protein D6J61_26895 [Salmonella enterica subsp. enterica serovar Alachua]|nr:hypothetical protein [Salmonella enterica subsp. enterica serovar Alachua]
MTVALIKLPFFVRVDILAWFVLGFYYARHGWPESWTINKRTVRTLVSLYFLIAVTTTAYYLVAKPTGYVHYQKIVNIFGPATILVASIFMNDCKIFRLLSPFSKYSFTVFLCHVPVIFLVGEAWGHITHTHISESLVLGPITVALCIAITTYVCFHINHIIDVVIKYIKQARLHSQRV